MCRQAACPRPHPYGTPPGFSGAREVGVGEVDGDGTNVANGSIQWEPETGDYA